MSPYDSVDRTQYIEEDNGKFLVYRMPEDGEDENDYELVAECDTRDDAEELLKNWDDYSGEETEIGFGT